MVVMAMLVIVMVLPGHQDKEEESGFMEGSSQEGMVIVSGHCIKYSILPPL